MARTLFEEEPLLIAFTLPFAGAEDGEDGAADSGAAADTDQDGSDADQDDDDEGERKYPKAYVKRLRDEAKAERVKRLQVEARVKALEDAGKTDAQRAADKLEAEKEQKIATAEAKAQRTGLKLAVALAAKELKFVDPDDVLALIDMSNIDIDPTTGEPDKDDVAVELRRLAKSKPYLVEGAGSKGNGDGGTRGNPGKPAPTQADKTAAHVKTLVDAGMIPVPGA